MPDDAGNSTFADRAKGASPVKRLKPSGVEDKSVTASDSKDVEQYHVGGGWYEIDGEKYRGEDAARAALEG